MSSVPLPQPIPALPTPTEKLEFLLKEIQEASKAVRSVIKTIPSKIKPTNKGLSLFQVKNACFASYLTSLGHLVCSKLEGKSITHLPVLHLLIQLRITLEKIKPIETKLKYRIDKLLKSINKSSLTSNDSLFHKPNLAAFENSSDEDEDEDEDEKGSASEMEDDSDVDSEDSSSRTFTNIDVDAKKKNQVYRPPKLTSVQYDEGESENLKPKRMSKNLLRELQEEFSEAPEMQVDAPEVMDEAYVEKQKFEEDHFIRFNVSKKEKKRLEKSKFIQNDFRSLLEESD